MGLGIRRPLFCFCWIFVAGCAASLFFLDGIVRIALSLLAAVAFLLAVILARFLSRRHSDASRRSRFCAFLCLALVLGMGTTALREEADDRRTQVYAENAQLMRAVVLSREYTGAFSSSFCVVIEQVDGERVTGLRAYLECPYLAPLQIGDTVTLQATASDLAAQPGMERYLADGCRIYLTPQGDAETLAVTPGDALRRTHPLLFLRMQAARVQERLSLALRQGIRQEAGGLCAALLLGDRSHLDGLQMLQFRRAGASHLLALSGMHLGIVVAVFSFLLQRLRLSYRLRLLLVSVAAIAYLAVSGCALSTLRAALMLLYLQCAHASGKTADGLTSLSLFFAVCVAFEPYMLLDVTLWLTTLATAVPVAILPALRANEKPCGGVAASLRVHLLRPVVVSLLCLVILILPMWLSFGEMSLLSPVSSLLMTLPTTLLLALGVLWLLLYPLHSLRTVAFWQDLLADGMELLADAMLTLARRLSDIEGAVLSLRYDVLKVALPLLGAVLVLLMLLRFARRRLMALILAVSLLLCVGVTAAEAYVQRQAVQGSYLTRGNSELLVLCCRGDTVLCDVTDGSYSAYRTLLSEGLPAGQTEVDALLLTHYHGRHVSLLERLSATVCLRKLYLPLSMPYAEADKAAEDEGIARKLTDLARERGIEVVYYEVARSVVLTEEIALSGLQYAMIDRSAHPLLVLSLRMAGEISLSYAGSAFDEHAQTAALAADSIAASEVVILGGHGPLCKSPYAVERWGRTLSELIVHGEAAGAYLTENQATLDAMTAANCRTAMPTGDGDVVSFVLPLRSKDGSRGAP